MSGERGSSSLGEPNRSQAPIVDWGAIQDFKELLSRTGSGTPIAHALPKFARDRIAPLLSGITSYKQFAASTDFSKGHMRHAVYGSQNHAEWAAEYYSREVIEHVEDVFLDTQLYPRLFPEGLGQGESRRTKRVKVPGASEFPHLIAECNKISEARFRRIMGGTSEAFRVSNSGLGAERTREILESSAQHCNDESDRENAQRDRKIYSGMDRIAQDFTDSLRDVRSSAEYRARMRALNDRLGEATEAYNNSVFRTAYDEVRNDFGMSWKLYVADKVRELYFTSLFEKAFPAQREPQVQQRRRSSL